MQQIQKERADSLQKIYGDKPCTHGDGFFKEYTRKGETGDLRCVTCYKPFRGDNLIKNHLIDRADN